MKRKNTLRKQVILLSLSFLLVLFTVVGMSASGLIQTDRSHRQETAEIAAVGVANYCNDLIAQLEEVCFLTVYNEMFYDALYKDLSYYDALEIRDYIQDNLRNLIATDSMYKYIGFATPDGGLYASASSAASGFRQDFTEVYELITRPAKLSRPDSLRNYVDIPIVSHSNSRYMAYVEKIFFYQEGVFHINDVPALYMILLIDLNAICEDIKAYKSDSGDLFLIVNDADVIVASDQFNLVGEKLDDIATDGYAALGEQMLANGCWRLYTYTDTGSLGRETMMLLRMFVLLAVLVLIVLLAFVLVFTRRIVSPLSRLNTQLNMIPADIHGIRVSSDVDNEVGELTNSINKMLDQVETTSHEALEAHEKLYASELARSKLRLAALQNQINPHFLYNTLECLRSIGNAYGVTEVATIAYSMSKIFRYCIKGAEIVTVEDELKIIQEYMSIIDIRFMGRHTAIYEVDPEILNKPIIKMSLQPIIENAVYHGLEAADHEGLLVVKGSIDGAFLHFSIEDNGVGIEPDQLREMNDSLHVSDQNYFNQSKRSIGLNNINMRCRLYYGEKFNFHIDSQRNRGTKVSMDIPLNS